MWGYAGEVQACVTYIRTSEVEYLRKRSKTNGKSKTRSTQKRHKFNGDESYALRSRGVNDLLD